MAKDRSTIKVYVHLIDGGFMKVAKPSPATVKSQSSVILSVVSLPTQLHCPRIQSVTPAAIVGFDDTTDWICGADNGNKSQQRVGDFGGGLEQFWVTFRPQRHFFWAQNGPKKPI